MKNLVCLIAVGFIRLAANGQSTDSAEYFFSKGIEEKDAARFREAEKNFDRVYKINPKNLNNLIELANVLKQQGRYREAVDKYAAAEALDARNAEAIENLATLSVNMHKWEQGIAYVEKMKQLGINKPVNFLLAQCYYQLEHYSESIKYCERAFKEDPKNAEIPYTAALCFMNMHNYKRSAGCYEQAIALDSSRPRWMYEAGLMWYAVPDDKKALYWMVKAGERGYTKSNEYMENLASAYLNAGNLEKGIDMLKQVLERKPEDPELLYDIADAYYRSNKYQEAIDYWDKILSIDKKNASALYMIGMSYQKKGEKEKGIQLCDKAIEMDPSLRGLRQERKLPAGL